MHYRLGIRRPIHALVHVLTQLMLGAYNTGSISETVEDRAKAAAYVKSTRAFDCRQNV